MVIIESECVGCPVNDIGCIHEACPYYAVKRYYCDECKSEVDVLYKFDNDELCQDCVLEQLERVDDDD